MRLAIVGPMFNGVGNFGPIFEQAEADLVSAGYEVVNPLRHGSGGEWKDYMIKTIPDVMSADGVALLPRWRQSRGARLEMHVASELEIVGRWVEDWVRIARNS